MNVFDERDIDNPRTVRVERPCATLTDGGDWTEDIDTVVEAMTADIQFSLKVRRLVSETASGVSGDGVWIMFCRPPVHIERGDRVTDDTGRAFVVDAAADWGSHTECVMREV